MNEGPAQRTYCLVCTEPAVQGCKQEKYLERLFTPLVASFNAIRQAFSQQGQRFGAKFANFICRPRSTPAESFCEYEERSNS